jgi:hypothetical protein
LPAECWGPDLPNIQDWHLRLYHLANSPVCYSEVHPADFRLGTLFEWRSGAPFADPQTTLDSAAGFLGTAFYGIISFYFLLCVMHGQFTFGMRFFLFPLHPMKVHKTYMNSFLFNCQLLLMSAMAVVQFATLMFQEYARGSGAEEIFAIGVSNLYGLKVSLTSPTVCILRLHLWYPGHGACLCYLSSNATGAKARGLGQTVVSFNKEKTEFGISVRSSSGDLCLLVRHLRFGPQPDKVMSEIDIGLVVSKAIGVAIILGSFGVKIPQILKMWNSKSAEGLSKTMFVLQTFG